MIDTIRNAKSRTQNSELTGRQSIVDTPWIEQRSSRAIVGIHSEKGLYRSCNEDSCVADIEGGVFVVVDGVGGQRGGTEASKIVSRVVPIWLAETLRCGWRDADVLEEAMIGALQFVRDELKLLAAENPTLTRAAATAVITMVDERRLYVARVGDCRAYLFRNGNLSQLTKDQSFIQQAMDAGLISAEQARLHPWRQHVTNVISARPMKEPLDLQEFALLSGDRVVLSTDGLHEHLSKGEMELLLTEAPDAQTAAEALAEMALFNDSHDNASCIVLDIP